MNLFISKQGRLGNNLFQYFFGYVLSKKLNCNFFTLFNLNLSFLPNFENHTTKYDLVVNEIYEKDGIKFKINNTTLDKNIDVLCQHLLQSKCNNILIQGFFQDINYYLPYVEEIRSFFKNSLEYQNIKKKYNKNSTGIIVRKGDIVNTENELPDSWYFSNAKNFENTPIFITSDTLSHPTCQTLIKQYNAISIHESSIDTIFIFSCFQNLILSQGTFSWWAGFLNQNNVYCKVPSVGWNSNDAFINLKIPWWNWI
jgi:hypothetical protein